MSTDPAASAATEINERYGISDYSLEYFAAIIRREHEPYMRLLDQAVAALDSFDHELRAAVLRDAASLGIGRTPE